MGRYKGNVKIREMEDKGYKDVVLGLRNEGKSHGYIARLVTDEENIDPDFNISSVTIGKALGVWGDPNYKPPKSVTRGRRRKGSIHNFKEDIMKLLEADNYIGIKGIEKYLRSRGFIPGQSEVGRYIKKELKLKVKWGSEYLSPWDAAL